MYIVWLRKAVIYKLIAYHNSEESNSIAAHLWLVSAALLEAQDAFQDEQGIYWQE